eukprot:scaffold38281_cov32-Tisochrysis_lutea.AAC.1
MAGPSAQPASMPPIANVFAECSNCGKSVLNANLALHEAHCFRLYERCERCGESVKRGTLSAHQQERNCLEHSSRAATSVVSGAGGHVRRLQSLRKASSTHNADFNR